MKVEQTAFFLVRATAEHFIRRSKESDSTAHDDLAALSFGAFALEGYLNMLGAHHVSCWSEIEKGLNPEGKLSLLAEIVRFKFEFGARPFQSFRDVFKYRNAFSHPKLETKSGDLKPVGDGKYVFEGWVGLLQSRGGRCLAEDAVAMIDAIESQLVESAQVFTHQRAKTPKHHPQSK